MKTQILAAAFALGVDMAAVIPCPQGDKERTAGAASLLLLFCGYAPHTPRSPALCTYYLASNRAYLAAKALEERFELKRPEETQDLKSLIVDSGLGHRGRNTLAYVDGLGSRFSVQPLFTELEPFSPVRNPHSSLFFQYRPTDCEKCGACARACPTNALKSGFDRSRCLRQMLNQSPLPQEAQAKLDTLLGCDVCQAVCPKNSGCAPVPLSREVEELFTFDRLLAWTKEDQQLFAQAVGGNYSRKSRLWEQARCMHARGSGD